MDKELPKVPERFTVKAGKLGQGTFSYIYEAFDSHLRFNVALKMEKKDKSKNILKFEYQVLQHLKGLQHVPNSYEYVQNVEQNFIVMDLLGINLAKARRCLEQRYDLKIAIQILIEMVIAVKEVHKRGFIHRDVKASNFVLDRENRKVFIVDFGLAKKHLDSDLTPVPKRKNADFRGTVSFASLNAHNNVDLARRDDMWSLYFTMLDFLNEKLEWREQRDFTIVQVKDIKTKNLRNPKRKLWVGPTKNVKEVHDIFQQIHSLRYADKPNYESVINNLVQIYNKYDMVSKPLPGGIVVWELKLRQVPHNGDPNRLEAQMKASRQQDFQEYFNSHRSMTGSGIRLGKSDLRLFPEMAQPQQQIFPMQHQDVPVVHASGIQGQDPQKMQPQVMQMMSQPSQNLYDPGRVKPGLINGMQDAQKMPTLTMHLMPQQPSQNLYDQPRGKLNQPPNVMQNSQMRQNSIKLNTNFVSPNQPQNQQASQLMQQTQSSSRTQQNHMMLMQQQNQMVGPGMPHQIAGYPQKQQDPSQYDWVSNFLHNQATPSIMAQQKNGHQQQMMISPIDQQNLYMPPPNQSPNLGPGGAGNNQQLNTPCNVQQFINIQYDPQKQLTQKPQQPYMNVQQQVAAANYNQMKQAPYCDNTPSQQQQLQQQQAGLQQNFQQIKQGGPQSQMQQQQQQQAQAPGRYNQAEMQRCDKQKLDSDSNIWQGNYSQIQSQQQQYQQKSSGSGGLGHDIVRNKITNFKINQGPVSLNKDAGLNMMGSGEHQQLNQQQVQQQAQQAPHQLFQSSNGVNGANNYMLQPGQTQGGNNSDQRDFNLQNKIMDQSPHQLPTMQNYQYEMQKQGMNGQNMMENNLISNQYGPQGQPQQNRMAEMYYQQNIGVNHMQQFPNVNINQNAGGGEQVSQSAQLAKKQNKRIGNLPGKLPTTPPEGFYCYYPELFERRDSKIFTITKVPRKKPQISQEAPPQIEDQQPKEKVQLLNEQKS